MCGPVHKLSRRRIDATPARRRDCPTHWLICAQVWRFPYLCYRNGGGSFLIPYFAALLLVGVPAFMLELALGQRFQRGATHCYLRLHKRLAGVGIAGTGMAFATLVYYQTILAWSLVYAFHSFRSPLPWKRTDAERFWEHGVLRESMALNKTSAHHQRQNCPWL